MRKNFKIFSFVILIITLTISCVDTNSKLEPQKKKNSQINNTSNVFDLAKITNNNFLPIQDGDYKNKFVDATIKRDNLNKYYINATASDGYGCFGSFKGLGYQQKDTIIFKDNSSETCEISVKQLPNSTNLVIEENNCSIFHGWGCGFMGVLYKNNGSNNFFLELNENTKLHPVEVIHLQSISKELVNLLGKDFNLLADRIIVSSPQNITDNKYCASGNMPHGGVSDAAIFCLNLKTGKAQVALLVKTKIKYYGEKYQSKEIKDWIKEFDNSYYGQKYSIIQEAEKTCNLNDGAGCFNLGVLYAEGKVVKQDYAKANTYYTKSCNLNDGAGCSNLGNLYLNGQGVTQDYAKANTYWTKSCALNIGHGCSNLGVLYTGGKGTTKDYIKAKEYYDKACNMDYAEGCHNLGVLHDKGLGVEQDYVKANIYYSKACNLNKAESCFNLGISYYKGRNVTQDYAKAKNLYNKACNMDYAEGCNNLGVFYKNGQGVKQDYVQAKNLYNKACNMQVAGGCLNLGILYYEGQGVKQDYIRAKTYFKKACDLGEQKGCDAYRILNQ